VDREEFEFRQQVARFAEEKSLFANVRALIVGVSGGADSVALLDWLVSGAPPGVKLIVAHLNHCLRGSESDGDEAFVTELAESFGLELVTRRTDITAYAASQGMTLEEAGRSARYRFFTEICAAHGGDAVAVAHHADDQAETVLMRLLRGSGMSGLAAMRAKSADGRIIRPLLVVYRRQIETYLLARGLSWRDDASNTDCSFLRNRIRHELLPLLATYNPAISERLCATADVIAEDETALDSLAQSAYANVARQENGQVILPRDGLGSLPIALQRRLFRKALAAVGGSCRHLAFTHLQSIERICSPHGPAKSLDLPNNCRVESSYGTLVFSRSGDDERLLPLTVNGPGSYPLGDGRILKVTAGRGGESRPDVAGHGAVFSPAAVPFPWYLRYFMPGDRFVPSGMSGHRKVKDFFISLKVPRQQRSKVPILECNGCIFWLCGYRVAAGVTVTDATAGWIVAELLHNPLSGLPEATLHGK